MSAIPGLRSPSAKVGRLVYFGRMLDKVRLEAAEKLPAEYRENLGEIRPNLFDSRLCAFLRVRYADLKARVLAGAADAEALAWAEAAGGPRTDAECHIWNEFMLKLGWRDDRTAALRQRIQEYGFAGRPIETWFDLLDWDEGRLP